MADFLDSFSIPWAPVWGNYDNQDGPEFINTVVSHYLTHPLCVYEKGDPSIGNGNYVIAVEENGKIVEGIIKTHRKRRIASFSPIRRYRKI